MERINEDFESCMKRTASDAEIRLMGNFITDLKGIDSVECIYMRFDFTKPGENITCVNIISDGKNKEVEDLKILTETRLSLMSSKSCTYRITVLDLNTVLKMKDGFSRNIFRAHLSDLYTNVLFDRRGYFTKLQGEIIDKTGPLGVISLEESLGELETEKEAPVVFKRTL